MDPRLAARRLVDVALDASLRAVGVTRRLDRLAATYPGWDVLVLGVYQRDSIVLDAVRELSRGPHRVRFALGTLDESPLPGLESITLATGMRGNKFENINELVARANATAERPRWTLLLDDDVLFPPRFLERFLAVCEHFDLSLAQPAMSRRSHASWHVTRRQPASLVRETRFVEGGQLTAMRSEAADELLPFPEGSDMWGLDLHWAAVAVDRGWKMGVVDATPVRHELRPTGQTYSAPEAAVQGREFVSTHRSLTPEDADRTVAVHRTLRR
jgi:hypothetical protein